MNHAFLFLYPDREYIDFCLGRFGREDYPVGFLSEIIDARYRKNGYKIYWLVFGKDENQQEPNLPRIHPCISIHEDDRIISCGVSFLAHTTQEIYPNPGDILAELPENPDKLAIGGFHMWDCVDKMARYAHRNGINTFVDEDTTELFFNSIRLQYIPLIRTDWSLSAFGHTEERDGKVIMEHIKKLRRKRPWLPQN